VSFFVLRQSSGRLSPEILLAMFGDEIYQHSLDTPEQKVDLVNAGPNGESIRLQMVSEILLCPPEEQATRAFMFNSSRFASF
jgi:hypothetical protein